MRRNLIVAFIILTGLLPVRIIMGQEADAVLLSLSKEYRLSEDGSVEMHYQKQLKLLTHYAFHSRYGETFVVYDPRYQQLRINESYTIMADGRKTVTPDNAFNEVLPRFAASVPAYSSLREMVITHTGLEVGSVIHLDYTLTTSADHLPAMMAAELLVSSSPIEKQTLMVDVPENTVLQYKTLHIRTAPEIIRENGRKRYVWRFTALDAKAIEPFLPDDAGYLPAVLFSTAGNLYEMISWMTSQEAFHAQASDPMKTRLAGLSAHSSDPVKRMLEIQKLVVDELNLFDVPAQLTGYRVRTPDQIWAGNGGTELEKCVLMHLLLEKAGIPASVYAVFPTEYLDKSIGCLHAVKGFVVGTYITDVGPVFLSPKRLNDLNLIAELTGCQLVLMDPNAENLYIIPVEDQAGSLKASLDLTFDSNLRLTGTIRADLHGAMNPFPGLHRDETLPKNLWSSFASASHIKSFEISTLSPDHASISWVLEDTSALQEQDGYYFLSLPNFKKGFSGFQISYLNTFRASPLSIPYLAEESISLSLELPEKLTPIGIPRTVAYTNKVGTVSIEAALKNRTLLIKRELILNKKTIDPGLYNDLRLLVNEWNDMNNWRLVFIKDH